MILLLLSIKRKKWACYSTFPEAGGPGKFFPVLGISNTAEFIKQQKSGLIPGLIITYHPENIAKLRQANLWILTFELI
jgi:hypothetical protein